MKTLKSIVLALFVLSSAISFSQTEKSHHKIVFQMTTADTMAHKALMKQLGNIKSVAPETEIEVVCHGPGLEMLQKEKTIVLKGIQTAKANGVIFQACEFSLKERKVEKSAIIMEASYVKAGIIHIVEKQEAGWSYIKAGF
jgi:intracellular sulfur oxidation DsrE/DsrF family protein